MNATFYPSDLVLKRNIMFAASHTIFFPRRVNFDEKHVHRKYSATLLGDDENFQRIYLALLFVGLEQI